MAGVPSAPQIHIRPKVSVSTIQFNWLPPVSDGGSAITGYTIESADDPLSPYTVGPTARTYIVTGLTNNVPYTYTIAATNGNGTGAIATFRTVKPGPRPNPVSSASATAIDSTNALVSWTPAATGSGPVATWTVPLPTIGALNFTSVILHNSDIVVTDNTEIWINRNFGNEWNVQAGFTSETFISPLASNGVEIFIISTGPSGSTLWSSTDGDTWTGTLISSGSYNIITSDRLYQGTVYVANSGSILKTVDFGSTWTPLTFPGSNITGITATGINVAVCTSTSIYISDDGGSTWNAAAITADFRQIACSSDFSKIAASYYGNSIYISIDSGSTWTQTSPINSSGVIDNVSLFFDGYTSILIVADRSTGYIYTSTDDGSTWTLITGAGSFNWNSIYTNGSESVAVANGLVQTSNNYGNTWVTKSGIGSLPDITSIVCSSNGLKAAFASTYVWTSSNSGASWSYRTNLGKFNSEGGGNKIVAAAVAASSDFSLLYAACNNDNIWVSNDVGLTWTALSNSPQLPWLCIACSSDGTIIAAGDDTDIYISQDSGSSWNQQSLSSEWVSIAISSDGTKVIAGQPNGAVYRGVYSGSSWTWTEQIALGTGGWFSVASSANGSVLVAADITGGKVWVSNDSGTSWAITGLATGQWIGVSISADGMTIAAISIGVGGEVWSTTNSGTTWSQEPLSDPLGFRRVAVSADGYTIYVAGNTSFYIKSLWTTPANPIYPRPFLSIASSGDGMKLITGPSTNGYIWTSADGGATWTEQTGSGRRDWSGFSSSANGTILYAIDSNIYKSSDSGVTWQQLASGPQDRTNTSTTTSGTKVAAVANDIPDYVYISLDAGVTWTQSNFTSHWTSVAYSSDGSTLIAVEEGMDNGGYIWVSIDDGVSWTQQTPEINIWTTVTSSSDGTILYAAADNDYIYKGVKSGASWDWAPLTNSTQRRWTSIACSANGSILSAITRTNSRYIYISTDSGSSWTTYIEPGARRWRAITCSSDGTKIAAVSLYAIYTTPDTGTTWFSRTGTGVQNWTSIVCSSDGTYVAAVGLDTNIGTTFIQTSDNSGVTFTQRSIGSNTGPGTGSKVVSVYGTNIIAFTSDSIYKSLDSGVSWSLLTSPSAGPVGCMASSPDQTKLFAGIQNDYIYASTDGGSSWNPLLQSPQLFWNSIACSADGTKIVAVIDNAKVYASTDSGASWTETILDGLSSYAHSMSSSANGSIAIFADGGIVAGNQSPGYLWISRDSGTSWSSLTTAGYRGWTGVSISADGTKMVAANEFPGGSIYISTDSGVTWIQDLPSSNLLGYWNCITISSDGSKIFAGTDGDIGQAGKDAGAIHIKSLGGILPVEIGWYVVRIKRDDAVGPKYLPKVNIYPYSTNITIPNLDLANHSYNFYVYGVNDPGYSTGVETNSIP